MFIKEYGPLRDLGGLGEDLAYVIATEFLLRHAWTMGEDAENSESLKIVNVVLSDITNYREVPRRESRMADAFRGTPPKPMGNPMFQADFLSGKWIRKPRDMADALAMELMRSRKMLHICEKTDCGRYFVKQFSRDRYCSRGCAEKMRKVGQREWAKANYEPKISVKQKGRKKRT